jgi:chromosome segregation ATPase
MIDENADTADLTDRELLQAILRRLDGLEALVDDRLKDTRPLWQGINQRLERIEASLEVIERESKTARREMGLLREDIRGERLHRAELAERIEDLERRPN